MSQSTPTASLGWQDFFSTTLDGSITTTDTTISLAQAPTPTEGFLVIEPDSTDNREIIMYTSVSGNDVVCGSVDDRGIGGTTAKAHSSGVIVKMNTVGDMFEALQAGTGLSTGAITETKIGAGAVSNAKLKTGSGEPGGAWTAWTPTLSGRFDDAKWTKDCAFKQIGKTVFFRLHLTANDATPMSGGTADARWTLPVTAVDYSPAEQYMKIGTGGIWDDSVGLHTCVPMFNSTAPTTLAHCRTGAEGFTAITSTSPITWASGDEIFATGMYEAA